MDYYGNNDWRDYLAHYGVSKLQGAKVGSGRYPLGSGENPRQGTAIYYAGKAGGPKRAGESGTKRAIDFDPSNATIGECNKLIKEARKIAAREGYYDDLPRRGVVKEVDDIVDLVQKTGFGKRVHEYQMMSDKQREQVRNEYENHCSDLDKKRYLDEAVELDKSVFPDRTPEKLAQRFLTDSKIQLMDSHHPVCLYYVYQDKAKRQTEEQLNLIKDEIKDAKEAEKVVTAARKDIEHYHLDKRDSDEAMEVRDLIIMEHVDNWKDEHKYPSKKESLKDMLIRGRLSFDDERRRPTQKDLMKELRKDSQVERQKYTSEHEWHTPYKQDRLENNEKTKRLFEELSSARKQLKDAQQPVSDWNNLTDKQQAPYYEQAYKIIKQKYPSMTREDSDSYFRDYSGHQMGNGGPFDLYIKSRGITSAQMYENEERANTNYRKAVKRLVDDVLGEYQEVPISRIHRKAGTVGEALTSALERLSDEELTKGKYWI